MTQLTQLGLWRIERMSASSLDALPAHPLPDLFLFDSMTEPTLDALQRYPHWRNVQTLLLLDRTLSEAERIVANSSANDVLLLPAFNAEVIRRINALLTNRDLKQQLNSSSQKSEERYALLAVGANDGLWDWNLITGHVYYSPRWKSMLGHRQEEIGQSIEEWLSRVVEEDLTWVDATLEEQIENPSSDFRIEYRMLDAEGKIRWMLCRGSAVRSESGGQAVRMAGSMTDITDHKEQEEALRLSEERYALAIKASNDGLWDWNLVENRIFYAPRWKQMIGFQDDEISSSPSEWFDRVLEDDLIWLQATIDGQLERDEEPFEIEYRIRHADGTLRWMLCHGLAIHDLNGKTIRIVGSQSDISAHKLTEQRMLHDTFHDKMTGFPNRALFIDRLTQLLHPTPGKQAHCVAMLAEINRFDRLTDTLGPEQTNHLLMETALRLSECLDVGDTLARLDGAQFGFVFDGRDDPEAAIAARCQRITEAMSRKITLASHSFPVTLRLGASFVHGRDLRAEDLVREASRAMHRNAQEGRSSLTIFSAEENNPSLDALQLEQALRMALEAGNQIELHYQPIIDLSAQRLAGFESLMRWQHPEFGMISPDRFIPIAEQSDLILPLGRMAMSCACQQLKQWHESFPSAANLFMTVNVSGIQLLYDGFVKDIQAILTESGVNADRIKLEITESILLNDTERATRVLRSLKDMKLKLAIDDFGTGYSSLSYLHKFQFDAVKIDRSFVRAMQAREENTLILRMICDLARAMGYEVIAEGIETAQDADRLSKLGCHFGQGFYFSPPKGAQAFLNYLTQDLATANPDLKLSDRSC